MHDHRRVGVGVGVVQVQVQQMRLIFFVGVVLVGTFVCRSGRGCDCGFGLDFVGVRKTAFQMRL